MKRTVALLIHDGMQALDVAGPLDVFAEATALLPEHDGYHCSLIATSPAPLRASNGMMMIPHIALCDAQQRFDIVLIAGGPLLPEALPDERLSAWLVQWGSQAERYGSICTGAFTLGHAGLLDGRTVTTHWQNAERLGAMFPQANVEFDRIYARDGAVVTSAGVTAGIDLTLALVGEDHGEALALACAKRLIVVAQRQGGQSQFSPLLTRRSNPGTPLDRVQNYVLAHYHEPLPIARLAEIAGTSVRSVSRLFVEQLGTTPHDFVEGVRIDQARNRLEATDAPLKSVAFDSGFTNPAQMRAAFVRRLKLTPACYRRGFCHAPRYGAVADSDVSDSPS